MKEYVNALDVVREANVVAADIVNDPKTKSQLEEIKRKLEKAGHPIQESVTPEGLQQAISSGLIHAYQNAGSVGANISLRQLGTFFKDFSLNIGVMAGDVNEGMGNIVKVGLMLGYNKRADLGK
ncbi:MAG: amidase [Candidatus Peribacteria bacterium]|jgi:hypothetical protein|nr:amidase [Candidatus Peribacteria bacterium]